MSERLDRTQSDLHFRRTIRRNPAQFRDAPGEAEADAVRDAYLKGMRPGPAQQAAVLSRADSMARARVVGWLQRELGNAYVMRLMDHVVPSGSAQAERQHQLQRQEAKEEGRSRITQGPGGVPAVQVGKRFPLSYHPGVRIGTSIILDVFEQGEKTMIAWYDVSRSRHEIRPLDLFEDWIRAEPAVEMRPSDWRAYSLLDKVSPREWYEHRKDPVGFFMRVLEGLRPGTAEEKRQVEKTLAPAAYRAAIKRIALDNLAQGEKETREILGRGPAFFANLAKPWGPLERKKAALVAAQARLRGAAPSVSGGPERQGASSSEYDVRQLALQLAEVERQMAARGREVPLLQVMQKQGIPITAAGIQKTLRDILSNIATTRQAILTNQLDPMELKELRKEAPERYARFKVTLRGEQPAAEAFSRAKWEKALGLGLLDVMLIFVTGGVGAFFSAALGAAETAAAVGKTRMLERGTRTSPSGRGVVAEESVEAARLEAWLSGIGAALSGLSLVAELRAIRHRQVLPVTREAERLQRRTTAAFEEVKTLQRRLDALRVAGGKSKGRAARLARELPVGQRAGAQAVFRSTERATRQIHRELLAELRRTRGTANGWKRAAQRALKSLGPGQARDLEQQIRQIEALVHKLEAAAVILDRASKAARLPGLHEARKELAEATHGEGK